VSTEESARIVYCAACGQRCQETADICERCGEVLWHMGLVHGFPLKKCPQCERETLDLQPFCVLCGYRLIAQDKEIPAEALNVRRAVAEAVAAYRKREEAKEEEEAEAPTPAAAVKVAGPPGLLSRILDRLRGPAERYCKACQALVHPQDPVCPGCGATLMAAGVPVFLTRWPEFRPRLVRVLLFVFGTAALMIWTARILAPTPVQMSLKAVRERIERRSTRNVSPPPGRGGSAAPASAPTGTRRNTR